MGSVSLAPLRLPRVSRSGWAMLGLGASVIAASAFLGSRLTAYEARPLSLEGVELSDGDPASFVRAMADAWYGTELSIDAGSQILRVSRRDAGGRLDVEATVARARTMRGMGPWTERVINAMTDAPRALEWDRATRADEVHAFLTEIRRSTSVDAEPRRRDGTGGRSGTSFNLPTSLDALQAALANDAMYVRLSVRALPAPTWTLRNDGTTRFTEVVAAHETRYAHFGDEGRGRNIELAARFLDGETIAAGAQVSFNRLVGERTFERGFAPAIELAQGGRRTEGIGGGVCQVAATLHAAAFFAGFDILQHHPHTRNSTYIPAGLDAAVSWPNKDLVVRNPYPYPVRIHASAYRGTVRIELMGAERGPRVEWNTRVLTRVRRPTEREVDLNLPLGAEEVLDEGEDGSVLERTRTVFWPEGAVTEAVQLRYPMVTRLVRVGPSDVRTTEGATVTSAESAPEVAP
ncbi:MAG: VanW family protein [Sandaracinaceae bacterium]